MKKLFLALVLLAAPAWADDDVASLRKQIAKQEIEIHYLTERFEGMQAALIQEHEERTASLRSTSPQSIEHPRETASESWNRIEKENSLQQATVDAESNRDEIYWMEHKY